jgi:hypothetical protein
MNARTDELERLQRLRDAGVLTDDEFQREKQRVLGGGAGPARAGAPLPAADGQGAPEPGSDVEADERRKRTILYVVIGLFGLAVAIGLGIWLGRGVSGGESAPEANVAMAPAALPEDNMIVAAAAAPTDIRTLPMPEQLSRAFAAAFGTADKATLQVGGRTITYKPGRLIWLADRAVLISPGTASDDCHACAGTLAVHYLKAAGDGFQVSGAWPDAVPGAGGGAPPKWKLASEFTSAPAIYEEGGYTGQGCTSASASITELAPAGPVRSGPIRIVYSMDGDTVDADSPGGEIKGTIANVRKDVAFDVNYSGEQPFTEHWIRNGARFVLESGETRMPQC